MSYKPKPTGPIHDLKDIYLAWWQGSRGTVWFWIVPIFVVGMIISGLLNLYNFLT